MVYTEHDVQVRQEQCKDWLREAREPMPVENAESRPSTSMARALLALPILLISLATRLLGTWTHIGHRPL